MKASGFPYVLPMLLLSVAFFATPLAVLVGFSFAGSGGATLEHYARFFGDAFNFRVLVNTARLGLETVIGTTLLGVPIALLYWHGGRNLRQVLIFLTLIPMLTSNVVRTFAWIVILGRQGPISEALVGLGLVGMPTSLLFTELGLVMAMCQIDLPLIILPLIAILSRTPVQLTEAAQVSGAGPWRILVTVLLPLMLPGLLAGWILVFASTSSSFVTQAVIGGARNVYVPQLIYREVGTLFDWPLASAIAVVLLLSTGCLLVALTMMSRHRRLVGYA
ncbi:ABC transporter permease (plasmid) [Rhizobium leguminosarum]|uniref:Polyamine ABC transporter n=2 Tax=Rhizobium leguminosarum TaxID=384 RepID=A0A1B8RI17_RHILT|nr:ABC transporter permease [Rhizobium leguminosarum]AOO88496.1 polyamine ABC transporter [Rhizobium leguminosarum bv. trifolii]ASS58709.1 polyamine ABC transporter [Rhizobium leguminosarum bv. viciae]MBB4330523.1 putative spermidine/putrescine transport system permease protein [Rhizobium leguminosarum]MBB4339612.1 putative spermidine/putrescine transport system permease protein [Rhizobium leguminosarum]MBB4355703.1 putative spermidine/putrescine transport system permease protein [Rhizobium le